MRGPVGRLLARAGGAVWLRPALSLLLAAAALALSAVAAMAGVVQGDGSTVP